ncbi:MAG TPA: hypothetical protein VGQ36_08780 [Thermoanaerobaculia bacterium]|jgi:hypothetical protein|nr:hypothetical protein [Thermoanaerobaculia bacterium]
MAAKEKSASKKPRDVNTNVKRIFDEMIERSEQPPKRGSMKIAPPPDKKNGAKKK